MAFSISFPAPVVTLLEHKLFGHAAAEQDDQIIEQIFPGIGVLFVHRQLLRQTQGHAAGNDRHFVDRIGARQQLRHQGMPGFMIGRIALFFVADNHAAPLGAHHDLVFGQLQVEHLDFFLVIPSCQQSRFVYEILQVRAGKPGRGSRQHADVHVR